MVVVVGVLRGGTDDPATAARRHVAADDAVGDVAGPGDRQGPAPFVGRVAGELRARHQELALPTGGDRTAATAGGVGVVAREDAARDFGPALRRALVGYAAGPASARCPQAAG